MNIHSWEKGFAVKLTFIDLYTPFLVVKDMFLGHLFRILMVKSKTTGIFPTKTRKYGKIDNFASHHQVLAVTWTLVAYLHNIWINIRCFKDVLIFFKIIAQFPFSLPYPNFLRKSCMIKYIPFFPITICYTLGNMASENLILQNLLP